LPPGRRRTSGHAARRARPERHNPHSIATLRIILARLLLRQLPFLRIVSGLNVGIKIDFVNAGLPFRAWSGVPGLRVQLYVAEFIYGEATPHTLAFWHHQLGTITTSSKLIAQHV
jgi:hypothetical protein